MEQVEVLYDREGNTLTVWFGDPHDEYISEEAADDVVLMKDRSGYVIGFEKLNFSKSAPDSVRVSFEALSP